MTTARRLTAEQLETLITAAAYGYDSSPLGKLNYIGRLLAIWRGEQENDTAPIEHIMRHAIRALMKGEARIAELSALLAERERKGEQMREALRKHGRHDSMCDKWQKNPMGMRHIDNDRDCTCGLEAALAPAAAHGGLKTS